VILFTIFAIFLGKLRDISQGGYRSHSDIGVEFKLN